MGPRSHPEVNGNQIAFVGYFLGGAGASELACSAANVRAPVSLHGGLSIPNPEDAKQTKETSPVCKRLMITPLSNQSPWASMRRCGPRICTSA